jgi:hypothetical protein
MLIEPASKVSVPLTVVKRNRSRTPPRAMNPVVFPIMPRLVVINIPLETQVFDPAEVRIIVPFLVSGALSLNIANPVVNAAQFVAEAFTALAYAPVYPEVVYEPEPI